MPISATDNTKSKQMLDLLLSIPTKSSSTDAATDESFAELLAPPASASSSKPRESAAATSPREKLSAEPAKRSRRPDEVLPASSNETPSSVAAPASDATSEAAADTTSIASIEDSAAEPALTEEALSAEAERAAAEAAAVALLASTYVVSPESLSPAENGDTELLPTDVVDVDAVTLGDVSKNLWNQATTADVVAAELPESADVDVAATSLDAIASASEAVASDTETSVTTLNNAESNISEELSATISVETVGETQEAPTAAEIAVETASAEQTSAGDTEAAKQLDRDGTNELESSITSSSVGETSASIEATTTTDGSTSDRGSESSDDSSSSERATSATSDELSTSEILTSQTGNGATTSETPAIPATQTGGAEAAAAAAASGSAGRTSSANVSGSTSSNSASAQPLQAPPAKLPAQALTAGTAKQPVAASTPVEIDPAKFLSRVTKAFATARERGGPVQLRLNPPELGALKIEVQVQDGSMTARLEAETSAARAAILENLPQLRERLAEQGIRIDRFDVELLPDQSQQNLANHQGNSTPEQNSTDAGRIATRIKNDVNPGSIDSSAPSVVANDRLNVVV